MMNATEMTPIILMKKTIEELNEKARLMEQYAKLTQSYLNSLPKIDKYVEGLLLENNGTVTILLGDDSWNHKANVKNGFAAIIEKNTTSYPRNSLPYWENNYPLGRDVILNIQEYANYLRQHGYKVTVANATFDACSSTGKSECIMIAQSMHIEIA